MNKHTPGPWKMTHPNDIFYIRAFDSARAAIRAAKGQS